MSTVPLTQPEWRAALDSLPASSRIPAFFFAHGSPMLAFSGSSVALGPRADALKQQGPQGPLALFLKDFGPALLKTYKPKGIVVFSAHWETYKERLVTDYGDENPLLYDYYGFDRELYQLKFKSRGDSALSNRVVEALKKAGYVARTSSKLENRGEDGRGFKGPGLDHGVFIPFRLMFGAEFMDIPIVEASIDGDLSPESNWKLGKSVSALRDEGILILSGGLTIHNLRDFSSFSPETASAVCKEFDQAVIKALTIPDADERKKAMQDLTNHPGFRAAHPREDHFVPLYVAAGAGEGGKAKVLNGGYGISTVAFGL
ncbi:Extradiol ring-cleavage dioxygenase class III enzyme subunit B [Mycena floridula]|nr:Extradiol ring-cleavage dioxygenase class III enzyme subunit B [Mycena floridula]